MKKSIKDKLIRVHQIEVQMSALEHELESLLGSKTNLPNGFSFKKEILNIIELAGVGGITRSDIFEMLRMNNPGFSAAFDLKQIGSSLSYLKQRGIIERIERAKYRLV